MRKGLGNNLAQKCLAGMLRFLNPANFVFRSLMLLVRYYSNFQYFYVLPFIHFLSLVELERRGVLSLINTDCGISGLKTLLGKVFPPDPSLAVQKGLVSRLVHVQSPTVQCVWCELLQQLAQCFPHFCFSVCICNNTWKSLLSVHAL